MKYDDWKLEKENQELRKKYNKLLKLGLYEENVVESLPDMEILGEEKGLVFFKKDDQYGFYQTAEEEGVVYSYTLFLIENLSDEEYNEVISSANKGSINLFGKVVEIFGWVGAGVSLLLFLVGFIGGISIQNTSNFAFFYGLYESGAYLVSTAVFSLIMVIGRYLKCKDIS